MVVERLVESHGQNPLNGVTSQKLGVAAKWRQPCGILGFFGDEFHKENLHFRGRNFGEWLNLLVPGFYYR